MNWGFQEMYTLFSSADNSSLLLQGTWGVEREALRVTSSGSLAKTPHPEAYGGKLENPRITTDFSESQVELITPPMDSLDSAYGELESVHQEAKKGLDNEFLWPLSMPGQLPDENEIPIARYTGGRKAAENEIYRKGLALRYGKKMQMISGIHYNYSFSPRLIDLLYARYGAGREYKHFVNDLYFSLARNFLRYRWLLLYLFGASPFIDPAYEQEMLGRLKATGNSISDEDIKAGFATSLRMSKFGYFNSLQNNYTVSHNSLEEYAEDLKGILSTTHDEYTRIGLYKNGEKVQLNDHILQKDSEFYSSIRFKQAVKENETMLEALENRGVAYIEMRVLDLDPFDPRGISRETMNFVHAFMLYCLFQDSPAIGPAEQKEINNNHHLVALSGRKMGLSLYRKGKKSDLAEWAGELVKKISRVADLLESSAGESGFSASVEAQKRKLAGEAELPSERIQREVETFDSDYSAFGIRKAKEFGQNLEEICIPRLLPCDWTQKKIDSKTALSGDRAEKKECITAVLQGEWGNPGHSKVCV